MRNWLNTLIILSSFFSFSCFAADAENGKRLYEAGCVRCHNSEIFTRPDRKIKTLEGLKKRVHQCVLMAQLPWFDEEIDDVIEYLNVYFYNFGMK